jgi:hypothetical protein
MDDKNILENINFIFKDIFGRDNPFSIEHLIQRFCTNVPLPQNVKCAMTGADTWIIPLEHQKIVDLDAVRAKKGIEDWAKPKKPITSMNDIFTYWNEINYQAGNKITASTDVSKSDCIMNSSNIYMSSLVGNSKHIYLGYNNWNCAHMLACRGNNSCSLGMRIMESQYCSSSFEVDYSNKVSRSMFISDGFDLYECLFCFNLSSKQYYICNMPFEQAEYMKIKAMVIDWVINSFGIKA